MKNYGPQPIERRFETIKIPGIYGNHVPYDRGTDVRSPDVEPAQGAHAKDWNGAMLLPTGESLAMWIHEVEAGYTLNGVTAQSQRVRQFFPRHLTQPSLIVRGMVPNNYQYNRLASFVRMSQYWALNTGSAAATQRPGGRIYERHYNDGTAIPTTQLQIKATHVSEGRTHKGPHSPWVVEGYIKNIKAGATRFQFATEYEFEFIVAFSTKIGAVGLYEDSFARGSRILPWMDIFHSGFQGPSNTPPQNGDAIDFLGGVLSDLGRFLGLFD